jgi:hypothetical protein
MNIQSVAQQFNIVYDRYVGDTITLPYSTFDEIKIQQNDLATCDNINSALTKLYQNYLYIFKSSRIATNIIPYKYNASLGVVSYNNNIIFDWYSSTIGLSANDFLPIGTVPSLSDLDNVQAVAVGRNIDTLEYIYFASNGTNLIAFRCNSNNTTVSTKLSAISLVDNSTIKFQNITSLTVDQANKLLYVLDTGNNNLYQYDITGFLTSENLLQNRLIFKRSIGGAGDFNDHLSFNTPTAVTVTGNIVYVLDKGNGCIKKYDSDLNWLSTLRFFKDIFLTTPVDIGVDSLGYLYLLCTDRFIKYDPVTYARTTTTLATLSSANETLQQIVFSPSDTNIFYITSNKNIYKRFVSKPDVYVGAYMLTNFRFNPNEQITAFSSALSPDSKSDNNIIFSTYQASSQAKQRGRFSLFTDNINLQDIIENNSFDIYTLDNITVDGGEYLQNWVFNKALSRLMLNHLRLRDQLRGKFLYVTDSTGMPFFNGTRYLTSVEYNNLNVGQDLNCNIGLNEIFQNATVNRALKVIFNLQTLLFNTLIAESQTIYDVNTPVYIG